MDTVAIFIPTYRRPESILRVVKNIHEATLEPHEIYFIIERKDIVSRDVLRQHKYKYFYNERGTYASAINTAFKHTKEPLFFCGADDLKFHKDWLSYALMVDASVVGTNDLYNPMVTSGTSATHYLVKRKYIERMGGTVDDSFPVLYEYKHNYCDTEFIETAKKRACFKPCLDSIVEHLHWGAGKSKRDETYDKNNATAHIDLQTFVQRKQLWS